MLTHSILWRKMFTSLSLCYFPSDANSRHSEISQLLEGVQGELNEAKMDKHESARHQKKQELLESMKRLFPGVYGRLIDLCEPVHKKLVYIQSFFYLNFIGPRAVFLHNCLPYWKLENCALMSTDQVSSVVSGMGSYSSYCQPRGHIMCIGLWKESPELIQDRKQFLLNIYLFIFMFLLLRYTLAITRVLGRNMDAIVVDTEKTGKDCIQYLREQVSKGLLALYVL